MPEEGENFQVLFKKYRLKSEFATLSELGSALSEKGLTRTEEACMLSRHRRLPSGRMEIKTIRNLR